MDNFLFLNDFTPQAGHALAWALRLAAQCHSKLLIVNSNVEAAIVPQTQLVMARRQHPANTPLMPDNANQHWLHLAEMKVSKTADVFEHAQYLAEAPGPNLHNLAGLITKHHIKLCIMGCNASLNLSGSPLKHVLTHTTCPVLAVPETAPLTLPKSMAYITDLRYCRNEAIRFSKQLSGPLRASLTIAHIPQVDLPHLDDAYALSIFNNVIKVNHPYHRFYFSHIKERRVAVAADVLVNVLHHDLLVMAHHKFHYEMLTAYEHNMQQIALLPVPLLLFPS